MRVKIVNPDHAHGLKDPHTKRSPFVDYETGAVILVADVPDTNHWERRVLSGEIVRVSESAPVVNAPIAPLVTRGGQ